MCGNQLFNQCASRTSSSDLTFSGQTKRTPPLVGLVAALVGLVAGVGVHAAAAGAAAKLTEPPDPEPPDAAPNAAPDAAPEAPEAPPSLVAADATAAAPAFSGERELLALTAFARAVVLDLALLFPLTLPDEGADNISHQRGSMAISGHQWQSSAISGDPWQSIRGHPRQSAYPCAASDSAS
jgi:hypothetical protein